MTVQIDRERVDSFLQCRNTTPLVGFCVDTYYPLHRFRGASTLPKGLYGPDDLYIDAYMADYDRIYQQHAACPGDLVWSASAFWGVPWMEAAVGCSVEADHTTGSSRSHPVAADAWPTIPEYSPDIPWVARCLEMVRAVSDHAAGRYPVGVSLMRGVSDVLAALLGLDRTIFTMLDRPARIHELAERITNFWIAFGHAQLDASPRYEEGYGSFLYNLWAPGRCIWLQEDAAALLSPPLFKEFILPYDRRIAEAFDYCFLHMHPARYIPHQPLLDSELAVLELHIDAGGPSAHDLLPVYREILAQKPLLVWGDIGQEDLAVFANDLAPKGLALQIAVDTPEQAEVLYTRYFG